MRETVTLPIAEYERLCAAAEGMEVLQANDRSKANLAAGADELIPAAYLDRLLDGESPRGNPFRVYRNLRGPTQAALAEKAAVNRVNIAEIETGRKQDSVATLRALADALGITLHDLAY